jgi:hypothetical protein
MMDINYDGVKYTIKSDINEFTIGEYEKIINYLNNESDFFDMWFYVLEFLGLPKNVVDDLDANELIDVINSINLSDINKVYIKSIEIGGFTYNCEFKENGEPKITGKMFKLLEKVCKKDYYIADIMAILFKREDLSDNENYDLNHIEHKASLFREECVNISLPYVLLIANKYIKNIKSL